MIEEPKLDIPTKSIYYATTPIFYVNAEPHIGHAYTTTLVDVAARFHRLKGDDTYFLTGTDEHGERIYQVAKASGKHRKRTPTRFRAGFGTFGIL